MAQSSSTTQGDTRARVARRVVGALDAVRLELRGNRERVTRAIIARATQRQPFTSGDYERARRELTKQLRAEFVGNDAPVKVILRGRLAEALGSAKAARQYIQERNEFGRTLNQELALARAKFERRMRRMMRDAVSRKWSRQDVADELRDQWKRNAEVMRVVSWHTARAANAGALSTLIAEGESFVEIVASAAHRKRDRCDLNLGVFPVRAVRLPPFHPHCKCFARRVPLATRRPL